MFGACPVVVINLAPHTSHPIISLKLSPVKTSPERWRSLTPDPLVIAGMNALPSLSLPGGEDLCGGLGVGLGGGQQDDGVLVLSLALAVGQTAHGDTVGSTCQVHLTEEVKQVLGATFMSQIK